MKAKVQRFGEAQIPSSLMIREARSIKSLLRYFDLGVKFTPTGRWTADFARSRTNHVITELNRHMPVTVDYTAKFSWECTEECLTASDETATGCRCRCGGMFHGSGIVPKWAEPLVRVSAADAEPVPRYTRFLVTFPRMTILNQKSLATSLNSFARESLRRDVDSALTLVS